MSEQGHLLHVALDAKRARQALRRLPFPTAILSSGKKWTSFVPVDAPEIDWESQCRALEADLVEVWFDEDSAIELRWYVPGQTEVRLTVPFGEPFQAGEADQIFLGIAGPLSDPQVAEVKALLAMKVPKRDAELRAHGLERLVGLPDLQVAPADATLEMLRDQWPKLEHVSREASAGPKPRKAKGTGGTHVPRGRIFHVRRPLAKAREGLARLEQPFAILGANAKWTSVFPLEDGFHPNAVCDDFVLRCHVLEVAVDDAFGVAFRLHTPGYSPAPEVELRWGAPYEERGGQRVFFGELERLLTPARGQALRDAFYDPPARRDEWLRARGLEEALGVPVLEPLPQSQPIRLGTMGESGRSDRRSTDYEPANLEELRRWGQVVEVVEPDARKPPPPPPPIPPAPPLSAEQRKVVALHVFFLTEVWEDITDGRLVKEYRRHLPAPRRREIDELIDRMMRGASDEELVARVARILDGTWDKHDWLAAVRAPALVAGLSKEAQARWKKHLGTVRTPGA